MTNASNHPYYAHNLDYHPNFSFLNTRDAAKTV